MYLKALRYIVISKFNNNNNNNNSNSSGNNNDDDINDSAQDQCFLTRDFQAHILINIVYPKCR